MDNKIQRLSNACLSNNLELVKSLVNDENVSPDIWISGDYQPFYVDGCYALHLVTNRSLPILEFLLERGANPNCQDNARLNTPLHLAVYGGNVQAIHLLVNYGAVAIQNIEGLDPCDITVYYDQDRIMQQTVEYLRSRLLEEDIKDPGYL